MKNIFLIFCVFCFTSCTTLNGSEQCALIGQVYEGTSIGTSTRVSSINNRVYSYPIKTYNPICKLPKTKEEVKTVSDILPEAQKKQKQQNKELIMSYMGLMGLFALFAGLIVIQFGLR